MIFSLAWRLWSIHLATSPRRRRRLDDRLTTRKLATRRRRLRLRLRLRRLLQALAGTRNLHAGWLTQEIGNESCSPRPLLKPSTFYCRFRRLPLPSRYRPISTCINRSPSRRRLLPASVMIWSRCLHIRRHQVVISAQSPFPPLTRSLGRCVAPADPSGEVCLRRRRRRRRLFSIRSKSPTREKKASSTFVRIGQYIFPMRKTNWEESKKFVDRIRKGP